MTYESLAVVLAPNLIRAEDGDDMALLMQDVKPIEVAIRTVLVCHTELFPEELAVIRRHHEIMAAAGAEVEQAIISEQEADDGVETKSPITRVVSKRRAVQLRSVAISASEAAAMRTKFGDAHAEETIPEDKNPQRASTILDELASARSARSLFEIQVLELKLALADAQAQRDAFERKYQEETRLRQAAESRVHELEEQLGTSQD
mmetsp:Transcript_16961/g.36760  ORF Transcript_16961/g.36760 Transcript_16961/m.36760 type:complete len:205 (+) Transcript_16961:254-868(+)